MSGVCETDVNTAGFREIHQGDGDRFNYQNMLSLHKTTRKLSRPISGYVSTPSRNTWRHGGAHSPNSVWRLASSDLLCKGVVSVYQFIRWWGGGGGEWDGMSSSSTDRCISSKKVLFKNLITTTTANSFSLNIVTELNTHLWQQESLTLHWKGLKRSPF